MYDTPVEICASSKPNASVIWLHGLGADGHDFAPVIEMLDMPYVRFVLPHAPYRAVTLNNGYEMRAWYDLYDLNSNHHEDEPGIRESQRHIDDLIDREVVRGIPYQKIVIAGFSQGGAIALHTALRYPQPLAGILALSTYLTLPALLAQEKSPQNQHIPIMMAHGSEDAIIPPARALTSYVALKAAQYLIEWHEYPMAHSVCLEEINDIRCFLTRITAD